MGSYRTVAQAALGEYEEKKSRFIARLDHVETEEAAVAAVNAARAEHPMARHHVYAYVLRANNRVRYSDDGEPQKTAGLPVLSVLEHAGLMDTVCVVVRYFGGTLLGTGGLVRAYTKAPQNALLTARISTIAPCRDILIAVDYPLYEKLAYYLKKQGIPVVSTDYAADVTVRVRVLAEDAEATQAAIDAFCQGRAEMIVGDEEDLPIEDLADL